LSVLFCKAKLLVTASVPPMIEVGPEKVLAPEIVNVLVWP